MNAYCWKTGLIEFGRKTPPGAITLHSGPAKPLRETVTALARHGYGDGEGKLLVPGVPEAGMFNKDPIEALIEFAKRVANSLARKGF